MKFALLFSLLIFFACSSEPQTGEEPQAAATPKPCDQNAAMNKMLALNNVQNRLVAEGGETGMQFSVSFAKEAAPVSELIQQGKYQDACKAADEIAKKYKLDLEKEQNNILTVEQLAADGGKGDGSCSVAEAAEMQMEVHAQIQAAVDAGKKDRDLFQQFSKDTASFGQLLSTDPSAACELLAGLKKKYDL